jgi:dolichol-phosphate mannosyltransferase
MTECQIAVVIPCFRVAQQVLPLIARIGPEVGWIIAVDDACPEGSGDAIERDCSDSRVRVLRHPVNQGVGGALATGFRAALQTPARVIVKLDGDGQMDPALISRLAQPIRSGRADYAKGNRFHRLSDVAAMPRLRLFGNAVLSFLTKLSSGYWQIFDPTNGFIAIHRDVLAELPLDALARRYFFESDMLYQLGQLRAVVAEMPMRAVYDGAPSSLRPLRTVLPFLAGHLRNFTRRLLYSYFLRGFSPASLELLLAPPLLLFGIGFGLQQWWLSVQSDEPATAGTVMLAALPILIGLQLLLSWLNFDVAAEPRQPIHPLLGGRREP